MVNIIAPIAYICGVLDGDGSVDRGNVSPRLRLDVTDKAFALRFLNVLRSLGLSPYLNHYTRRYKNLNYSMFQKYDFVVHYYIVRATCSESLIKKLKNALLVTVEEKKSYLIGFYDSEGSFDEKNGVRFTNTSYYLLTKIWGILKSLGIEITGMYKSRGNTYHLCVGKKRDRQKLLNLMEVCLNEEDSFVETV